jgi:hypothetical protein
MVIASCFDARLQSLFHETPRSTAVCYPQTTKGPEVHPLPFTPDRRVAIYEPHRYRPTPYDHPQCAGASEKTGPDRDPNTLDIVALKRKNLGVHWEYLFRDSVYGTPDVATQHKLLNEVADFADASVLRTTLKEKLRSINGTNPRCDHNLIENRKATGKLVLAGF